MSPASPAFLECRARFFHQLGTMLNAGVPIVSAFGTASRQVPGTWASGVSEVIFRLESGSTFHESISALEGFLTKADLVVIRAGEISGRLDHSFKSLADSTLRRAQIVRRFRSRLMYPAFLLHAAIFIPPVVPLFQTGDFGIYLWRVLVLLLPLYVLVLVVVRKLGSDSPADRRLIETVATRIPVLGRAWSDLAMAKLCVALEALIEAGIGIGEAWESAGDASGSWRIRELIRTWAPSIAAGVSPGDLMVDGAVLPEDFVRQYQTAELSGSLDTTLRRVGAQYEESGVDRMNAFSEWLPRLIYFLVAGIAVWQIFKLFSGYLDLTNQAIGS